MVMQAPCCVGGKECLARRSSLRWPGDRFKKPGLLPASAMKLPFGGGAESGNSDLGPPSKMLAKTLNWVVSREKAYFFDPSSTSYPTREDLTMKLVAKTPSSKDFGKTCAFLNDYLMEGYNLDPSVEECQPCDGKGKVECSHCNGMGRENYTAQMQLPKGEFPVWCSHCLGSGMSYCSKCHGTGKRLFRNEIGFRLPHMDEQEQEDEA